MNIRYVAFAFRLMLDIFVQLVIMVISDSTQSERVHLIRFHTLFHTVGIQDIVYIVWARIVLDLGEGFFQGAPATLYVSCLHEGKLSVDIELAVIDIIVIEAVAT